MDSTEYWVASVSRNWSDTLGWSLTSGGTPGASVPDQTVLAIFDRTGLGTCIVDSTMNPSPMRLIPPFDGTIILQGCLLGSDSTLASGTLEARKDVSCLAGFGIWNPLHNSTIILDGTDNQKLINESGAVLPSITVDKTSGSVLCYGTGPVMISGDFRLNRGIFNLNGLDIQVGS